MTIPYIVMCSSGCLNTNHFENSEISFDYPQGWNTGVLMDLPGVIVGVSKSSGVDVKISKKTIPNNSSFNEVYENASESKNKTLAKYCYTPLSERTITVDRSTAYEVIYTVGCNQTQTRQKIREVWLEKNSFIYVITCNAAPPEKFESENTSCHVK